MNHNNKYLSSMHFTSHNTNTVPQDTFVTGPNWQNPYMEPYLSIRINQTYIPYKNLNIRRKTESKSYDKAYDHGLSYVFRNFDTGGKTSVSNECNWNRGNTI